MIVAPRQSHHRVIAFHYDNSSHNKKIAASPCDFTKPIKIVQAPYNDGKNENPTALVRVFTNHIFLFSKPA